MAVALMEAPTGVGAHYVAAGLWCSGWGSPTACKSTAAASTRCSAWVAEPRSVCYGAQVNWNESGTLLVSGSDDQRVCVWDYGTRAILAVIETAHEANIFCTRFMPNSADTVHHVARSGSCW